MISYNYIWYAPYKTLLHMVDCSKTGYIVHQTFASLTQPDCNKCVVFLDKRSTSFLAMLLLEHVVSSFTWWWYASSMLPLVCKQYLPVNASIVSIGCCTCGGMIVKIFKFLSWRFGHGHVNSLIRKIRLILKFIMSATWLRNNCNTHIDQYLMKKRQSRTEIWSADRI